MPSGWIIDLPLEFSRSAGVILGGMAEGMREEKIGKDGMDRWTKRLKDLQTRFNLDANF